MAKAEPVKSNQELAKSNPPQTTAVATTTDAPRSIRGLLQSGEFKNNVSMALPKHVTPDRFIRTALTALARTPQLADCTQESFFKCILELAAYGLEPDGRRAHLIPFKNNKKKTLECTLIIDWKGLAELIMRSNLVSYLHADVVYAGDVFEYNLGEIVQHIPWFLRKDAQKPEIRGDRYAAFAFAQMKDGTKKCEVMSQEDILSLRDRSQGWLAFKAGYAFQSPWDPKNPQSESEMFRKTVFRRLSKWLPLSPELRDAVEHDDDDVTITVAATTTYSEKPQLGKLLRGQEVQQAETQTGDGLSVEQIREQQLDELRTRIGDAGLEVSVVAEAVGRGIEEWTDEDLSFISEKLTAVESWVTPKERAFE